MQNFLDPYHNEEVSSPAVSTYPSSLAHDLACCMSDEEVELLREKYSYDEPTWEYLLNRHDFKREFSEWRQRLISEGNSFKLKLRAMAEEFLPALHALMNAETTAPGVRIDAFKYISKVAGLEPVKEEDSKSSGPKISIEIVNYTGNASPKVIHVG